MLKFDFVKRKVVIDPKTIVLDKLTQLWEADETDTKSDATKFLTYIHLVAQIDPPAPYYSSAFDEVKFLVKKDIWKDMELNLDEEYERAGLEEFLDEAVEDYRKAYEPIEHRAFRIFNQKIDQIRDTIDNTTPYIAERTIRGQVQMVSNYPMLEKMALGLGKMMDIREEMKARMQKEVSEEGKIRGGRTALSLQEQKLKDLKEKQRREAEGNKVESEADGDGSESGF